MNTERADKGIQAFLLDVFQDTYSGLYMDIFAGRLIENYTKGYQAGEIKADFLSYLNGIIRNKVF